MDNEWTVSIPPLALSKKPMAAVLGSLDNHYGQRDRLMASAARCRVKHLEENSHPCVGGKTIPGKRKKKAPLSPEQLRLLSRRIDPTEPSKPALPISYKPSPRKRLRVQPDNTEIPAALDFISTASATITNTFTTSTTTAQQHNLSPLYQTCFDIWPGAPSLGDLSHDKVKNLSELLKVRLSQAKFRVIAALEAEGRGTDVLYQQLKSSEECSMWPTGFIGKKRKIKLSKKCNQAPWGVTVGNGRNLKRVSTTMPIRASPVAPSLSLPTVPSREEQQNQEDGQHDQQQQQQESPRKIKRRTPADPALAAVTLQDGSRAFICKNCNKKYKNRGGLVYHRDRCKQRKPEKPINCACGEKHQSDQLVQCETCHLYSHLECLGLDENELNNEGAFHCTTCVLPPTTATDNPNADLCNTTASLQGPIWEDFSLSPSSTWTASPGGDALTPSLYHSDMGLLTPSTTIINTPSPAQSPSSSQQSDSLWFEFANFDTDFTFNDSQNEQ